MSISR